MGQSSSGIVYRSQNACYSDRWFVATDSRPATSGGARTEVYDEGEPPRGCCEKHASNFTLSAKLEAAMAWQLSLSRKSNGSYGMFITDDGRFNGMPKRASGITSSTAMWDQVLMKSIILPLSYGLSLGLFVTDITTCHKQSISSQTDPFAGAGPDGMEGRLSCSSCAGLADRVA